MGAVWDSPLPHNLKLVALAYADHADHAGCNIWPSISLIAKKTGYNERQVQRITRDLEKRGILVADGMGKNNVRRWRMDMDALARGDILSPSENARGDISDIQGVTFLTTGGGEMSPDPSIEPSLETPVVVVGADPGNSVDSKKKTRAHARTREAMSRPDGGLADDAMHARQVIPIPLAHAFDEAGILDPLSRLAIVTAWPEIHPADVLAWAKQRYRDNLRQPPRRQMGIGAMVAAMKLGHRARDECYYDAETMLWNFIT